MRKAFILACAMLALSLFLGYSSGKSPVAMGRYLMAQVGGIMGMQTSVLPNRFNTIAQQLKEKEQVLSEREKALQAEEARLEAEAREESARTWLIAGGIGGVLLALILVNFYMDIRRRKAAEAPPPTANPSPAPDSGADVFRAS